MLGAVRHNGYIPWDDDIDVGMIRADYEKLLLLASKFHDYSGYEIKNYRYNKYCDYVIIRIYDNNTYIDNPLYYKTKYDKRLYFDVFPLDYAPDDIVECKKQEKRINKRKRLLFWTCGYTFKIDSIKKLGRCLLHAVLKPFRNLVLRSLDNEMKRYSKTKHLCSMASQYKYKKQYMDVTIYGRPVSYRFENHQLMGPSKADEYLTQLFGSDYLDIPPEEKRRKGYRMYEKRNSQ
ncbi:lipopolysaccharide cholinephosphotransferase [Aristaeella hokkaidonensis]|nr:lipopolysaccharide cholinephosphotransferase [Aristaeella hokkaidonensis]